MVKTYTKQKISFSDAYCFVAKSLEGFHNNKKNDLVQKCQHHQTSQFENSILNKLNKKKYPEQKSKWNKINANEEGKKLAQHSHRHHVVVQKKKIWCSPLKKQQQFHQQNSPEKKQEKKPYLKQRENQKKKIIIISNAERLENLCQLTILYDYADIYNIVRFVIIPHTQTDTDTNTLLHWITGSRNS